MQDHLAFFDIHGDAVLQQLAAHLEGAPHAVFSAADAGQPDFVNQGLLPCLVPLKVLMKKLAKAYAYARYVSYLDKAETLQKALGDVAGIPRDFEANEEKVDAAQASL